MKKRKKRTRSGKPSEATADRPAPPRESIWRSAAGPAVALAVLGGAVWAVYHRSLPAPFIFDDVPSVLENSSIVRLWPLVDAANHTAPLSPSSDLPTAGRPLVNLSLAFNYHFSQLDPAGYRRVNLFLHVLTAFILWAIVRRALRLPYFAGRFDAASGPLALAGALLWALHPLQTEAVVYVTQRTELMVALCFLATLYCSLRYWSVDPSSLDPDSIHVQNDSAKRARMVWLVLAVVASAAGMASKEVMVSAPMLVLLFERAFIARSLRTAWQKSWPLYVGLASTWLVLLYLNYDRPRGSSAGFHLGLPAHVWWFTQCKVLLMYLKLAVWPWPLVIHYELPRLETLGAAWMFVLPVAALIVAGLYALWRNSAWGFVAAWVFAILSPTLVVPILTEVAAERRMYLPLAALATASVVGAFALLQKAPDRPATESRSRAAGRRPTTAIVGGALALATVYGVVCVERLKAFQDNLSLWQDTIAHQPENFVAHSNLGVALSDAERYEEAIEQYEEALRLEPQHWLARVNLGMALDQLGRPEEAIEHYQQALAIGPHNWQLHFQWAKTLADLDQLDEAIEHYEQATAIRPDLAKIHNFYGSALTRADRLDDATAHFQLALRLTPNDAAAHNNLGNVLKRSGKYPQAIEHYRRALELQPEQAEVHNNLASVLSLAGRRQEATVHFEEALRRKPDDESALEKLADEYKRTGQFDKLVELYRRVVRHQPDDWRTHNNLGIALTRVGNFPAAIEHYERAIAINPDYEKAHCNLGNALVRAERFREAVPHYREAIRLQPDYVEAMTNLVQTYAKLNRPGAAVATARKSLELARTQGRTEMVRQLEKWLIDYQANHAGASASSKP